MIELLVKGGTVYDGLTNSPRRANIAVRGGRIAAVGPEEPLSLRTIEASGLVVCPGFVDIHSHSDYFLLINPLAHSKVMQGVTTEVCGNCGFSAAPIWGDARRERDEEMQRTYGLVTDWESLPAYLSRLEREGISVNFVPLVGHNTIRASVMGSVDRPPTASELERMQETVEQALAEGAFGLSTGLIYPPACYATTEELVALGHTVRKARGLFSFHMRDEGTGLKGAIEEVVAVCRQSGVSAEISHLKTSGEEAWGLLGDALRTISAAIRDGLDIGCDRYPYTASNTALQAVLPKWVFDGGAAEKVRRLRDPVTRQRIISDLRPSGEAARDWGGVVISRVASTANKALEGRTVAEAAAIRREDPEPFVVDLLAEEEGLVDAILFTMSEANLREILRQPFVTIGSDAAARASQGVLARGKPHPRAFGTFARVLGFYVREGGVLDLASAIQKMTWLPSRKVGLRQRGAIRQGYWADLVVFDPQRVRDMADYSHPIAFPEGIEFVVVNGEITVEQGTHLGTRAGRVLRRQAKG